ncbi:MAG: hypothetical protein AB1646_07765 [Thermodesulfobacteriota bacterium]
MTELIRTQPDESSYDEIMQELAFERMVLRGLDDVRRGRVISNAEMRETIDKWRE